MADLPETRPESGFSRTGWTPEQRERKRETALRLVAEGKFGGAAIGRLGGYRTHQEYHRKKLMQEAVAENGRKNTQGIIKALEGMLNSGDKRIQLEAIREYRAVEDWTQKNLREEERRALEHVS